MLYILPPPSAPNPPSPWNSILCTSNSSNNNTGGANFNSASDNNAGGTSSWISDKRPPLRGRTSYVNKHRGCLNNVSKLCAYKESFFFHGYLSFTPSTCECVYKI